MILARPLLSEADIKDLVAFLGTLTDESMTPEIPSTVPSGLAIFHGSRRAPEEGIDPRSRRYIEHRAISPCDNL
jgi:hypothetical protein